MNFLVFFSVATLSFLIGFLVKLVDFIEDDLKVTKKNVFLKKISFPLGILYGLLISLVLIIWPILFPLAVGTILGEVIAKKIDRKAHFIALFIFILVYVFLTLSGVLNIALNFYLTSLSVIFFIASLLDEMADKYSEKFFHKNILIASLSFRPFLELTAFAVSLLLNEWIIWITIFSFDLAYLLSTRILPKLFLKKV